MFEILIRIESLCLESPSTVLLECGLLVLILGVLLWLAGSYFSAIILGLLGAVAGLFCGLVVSRWFNTSALAGITIGMFIFTLASVVFRNIVIILLATLVFALSGGIAYSTLILKETPARTCASLNASFIQPFSQMDTPTRLAYIHQIIESEESFLERLHLLLKETLQTVSLHKWEIILVVILGGIVGLLLSWSLRKLIMALCYSGVGTLLVLIGLEVTLLGMNIHLVSWFQERPALLTDTYLSLVGIGGLFQLVMLLSSKRKKRGSRG